VVPDPDHSDDEAHSLMTIARNECVDVRARGDRCIVDPGIGQALQVRNVVARTGNARPV
jgi:hypothetical protein